MPTWGWIAIAAAAVLVIAVVAWGMLKRKRTKQLQGQFGPEYDRTVETADSKRAAESELAARRDRREQLEIRPLSSAARERYTAPWQVVQAQFVDNPDSAVSSADQLIQSVMEDRGYPVGDGSTEDLRQAMRPYRALFDELVASDADEPMTRGRDDGAASEGAQASRDDRRTRSR